MKSFWMKGMLAAGFAGLCLPANAGGTASVNLQDATEVELFSASPTSGATSQVIGRIRFTLPTNSPQLSQMTITLGGASRSGLSNVKLWKSIDSVFDGFDT